jgi:putative transposase
MKLLADPKIKTIAVEHRDRLMRFGSEYVESALEAQERRILVIDETEVKDAQGMLPNRKLSAAIADAGWGEFRLMLTYKTQWYGSKLSIAPRFFASSKTCSECGHVMKSLPLDIRDWVCPCCGTDHERDVNAAKNLVKWYRTNTASSAEINACGDSSTGGGAKISSRHGSLKQESTTRHLSIS